MEEIMTKEVEIVEIQPVNNTVTMTLTISGNAGVDVTGCVGWIGHLEGGNTNPPYQPGYITVTTTDPAVAQFLGSLLNKPPISGTSTLVIQLNGAPICIMKFQSVTVSTNPPYNPVPAAQVPGQFAYSIIG